MPVPRLLIIVGLCLLGCGCHTPLENVTQTLVTEPHRFGLYREERRASLRHRKLADQAYRQLKSSRPGERLSADHARGFEEGFVDYLEYGGRDGIPTLPPRDYWKDRYQTQSGHMAVQNWFCGYQDGMMMAQNGGQRQWQTVPSSYSYPVIHGTLQ